MTQPDMTQTEFSIGTVAKAARTSPETVRHYEKIGLIPPPPRSNGRRVYGVAHRDRLIFIRHARALGFGLEAIRTLLDLSDHPGRDCAEADRLASQQLADVQSKIARLSALQTELERMVTECRHGTSAECRVIAVLSDHDLCLAGDHDAP